LGNDLSIVADSYCLRAPTSLERIACLHYDAWGVDRCPIIIKQQASQQAASKNSNKKQKARELATERSDVATAQQTTITRQYIYHFYLIDVVGCWLMKE
jgi:hypothetical protein